VIKGNADRADLRTRFTADPRVTRWCVQPSYRTRLMRAGQPVLFWASGSRRRDIPYGIWGLGRVAGPVRHDEVPLDLVITDPVRRDILRDDPGLRAMEVFRQPQGANPSYVTVAEFSLILATARDAGAAWGADIR
jgi:hypothetical protein